MGILRALKCESSYVLLFTGAYLKVSHHHLLFHTYTHYNPNIIYYSNLLRTDAAYACKKVIPLSELYTVEKRGLLCCIKDPYLNLIRELREAIKMRRL